MAIYRLPPSPFVGGRQPLDSKDLPPSVEEVEVNNPPPRKNPAILLSILIAWQPVPYQPQESPYFPAVTVEGQVPFTSKFQYRQSEDVPYTIIRKLNPADIAVPEDQPTPNSRVNLFTIIDSWKIDFRLPQVLSKLVTVEEITTVPFSRQYQYQSLEYTLPILPKKLPPSILNVPEDTPIPNKRGINLSIIIDNWKEEFRLPQVSKGLVIVEEIVPFTRKDQYYSLDYIHPIQARKLNPSLIEEVQFVPFSRVQLSNQFYVTDFIFQQQKKLVFPEEEIVPFRRVQLDNSFYIIDFNFQYQKKVIPSEEEIFVPFNRILIPTQYIDTIPQQQRKLNPSLLNVAENDPPFGQRTWLSTVLNSWEPLPPQHRKTNAIAQGSVVIIWLWRRIG